MSGEKKGRINRNESNGSEGKKKQPAKEWSEKTKTLIVLTRVSESVATKIPAGA